MKPLRNHMKRLYCEALLDLCDIEPLNSITVSKIVEAAGTARQTFYNHFRDINDLISYLPISFLDTASKKVHDVDGIRAAYQYATLHKSFFRQLPHHEGQNNFRESFILWSEQSYYDQYITKEMPEEERMHRMLSIDLYCSGVTCLFLEWCRADFSWPLEALIQIQDEMLPDFIKNN